MSDDYHSMYYDPLKDEPETSDIIIPRGAELTHELVVQLIDHYEQKHVPRLKALGNAYEGKYCIFSQAPKPEGKPDNRLACDFAKYISDTFNGFFIGVPVMAKHQNDNVAKSVADFEDRNFQEDVDAELAKISSNYGEALELMFHGEDGLAYSKELSPMSAFIVYDDSLRKRALFGFRFWYDEEGRRTATISDSEYVYYDNGNELDIVDTHAFGEVPFISYRDNEEKRGVYEGVLNLIDGYNKALSEKANDVDYFADAYMKLFGTVLDEDDLKNIRDLRILNFGEKEIVAEFMPKPSADETQENLIERLERLIFQLSMVADVSDENFGVSSGIALKYKLLAMSNLAKTKERKFAAAMKRRYRLLCNYPNSGMSGDDWTGLEFVFTQNFPPDLEAEASLASELAGTTSEETRIGLLSCVSNPSDELKKREDEKDASADRIAPYSLARAGGEE